MAIAMHCNLGSSSPRQSFSALITMPIYQGSSRSTYPLLSYSVLLLIRYVTLWPWPVELGHFSVCGLWPWRDQTLYQIWAKKNNPRRTYGDL